MAARAKKTDPGFWERIKNEIKQGEKGGKPGQWSARKAQLAVHEYKRQGGGYGGGKEADNHLRQWTDEQWGTKSGADSRKTGERYLPRRAREHLTEREYAETTAKKRDDTSKGEQFSAQPPAIAKKTAHDRGANHAGKSNTGSEQSGLSGLKRTELLAQATRAGISGRTRMSKDQLVKALG